ncbi:hypothetical protein EJ066_20365 [Mesorhizobium sp. M9A.F.Ca.ET.002.03.1.2]|uniref:hypothetical protein n=1 Tax=Mesorhizobium sp. M9A.F.Ca.ET.002.03.1.2 TaxID=2493668 RepID=UPI000F75EA5A|nr:hypothetical protein [Mesorhizobium sp. M9A.F.Ca.ET.002.03.1.2]AZN99288.1 hypothetical protein EJ066_20365 [Mesorhizobium sp. M9A.F.Ca.ET.002.03.1.2]
MIFTLKACVSLLTLAGTFFAHLATANILWGGIVLRSYLASVIAIGLLLASCAIPPKAADYSKVSSYQIALRVRCEMRDAVRDLMRQAIIRRHEEYSRKFTTDEDFLNLEVSRLPKDVRPIIARYENVLVGYEFNLDATETNATTGMVDFVGALSRGAIGLGLSASATLQRNGVENFRVLDTFGRLVTLVPDHEYCELAPPHRKNYIYPITGALELRGYAQTFLSMNQSGNLDTSKTPYTITLTFTTSAGSSVGPSVSLNPLGEPFELSKASGTVRNDRSDVHKVAIAFVMPTGPDERALTIAEQRIEDELNNVRLQQAFDSRR